MNEVHNANNKRKKIIFKKRKNTKTLYSIKYVIIMYDNHIINTYIITLLLSFNASSPLFHCQGFFYYTAIYILY